MGVLTIQNIHQTKDSKSFSAHSLLVLHSERKYFLEEVQQSQKDHWNLKSKIETIGICCLNIGSWLVHFIIITLLW